MLICAEHDFFYNLGARVHSSKSVTLTGVWGGTTENFGSVPFIIPNMKKLGQQIMRS